MENQHRHIKGYRELSENEIALMNEIKETGTQLETLLRKVGQHIVGQEVKASMASVSFTGDTQEAERLEIAEPALWHGRAKADLQIGIMELVRAVAQPTSF